MTWPFLPTTGAFSSWPDPGQAGYARKYSALKRLRILQEDFRQDVVARILDTHSQPSTRERISKFASVTINPARDITQAVCVAYDAGVRRILRGATEDQQAAFSQLVKESQASTKAPIWLRYAFFLGPTLVIPVVRKGKLSLEIIRPDSADILPDDEDPMGTPAAAAWSTTGSSSSFVMLDDTAWRYLDDQGRDTRPPQVHDLGYWPGAVFRLDEPADSWWPRAYQERLVDGTIACAHTYAVMQWVRKSQNKKFFSVIGELDEVARGQMMDPELALTVNSPSNSVQLQVFDFDTNPENFLNSIRFIMETLVESYGIPQSAVSYNIAQDGGALALSIKRERLTHIREVQIPYMDRAERDLWPHAVAVVRAAGHPLGRRLPPPDEVRDMLDLQWPVMRTIDDPLQRESLYKEQIKRGGVSPVDMIQEDHPELTREECVELMSRNISEQAAILEEYSKRGMVMDLASGLVGSAEAMGRLGPIIRDQGKPNTPVEGAP